MILSVNWHNYIPNCFISNLNNSCSSTNNINKKILVVKCHKYFLIWCSERDLNPYEVSLGRF